MKLSARLLILLIGLGLAAPAMAAPPLKELTFRVDKPVTITGEELRSEEEGNIFIAKGRVVIRQGLDRITAENVRLDKRTNTMDVWGNVVWYHGSDVLSAERAKIDLTTQRAKVFNGKLFVSGNHFYISGREIDKTGKDTYVVRDCTLTSCDGPSPDWTIKASWMKVTVEGYGQTFLPRFLAGPVPIFFLPYAVFPAKTKRQSGFLMPVFNQSQRDGFSFDLPFYWAWADWGDTTFHLQHSKRGEGLTLETRFMLGSPRDRGLFFVDYLDDRKAEEMYAAGELDTPTSSRYWIRGMFRADRLLPYGVTMNLIVDKPSDPQFIEDFKYWSTGLDKINWEFRKKFGTTLRDATNNDRLNRLQLRKRWPGSYIVADFQYQYDPTELPPGQGDDTFQKLPVITYSYSDKSIGDTDLYYNFRIRGENKWREEGEWGRQGDIWFNLYGLYNLGPYLNLKPYVGSRVTVWQIIPDGSDIPQDGNDKTFRDRYQVSGGLDLSTSLFKIYDLNGLEWKRVKHELRPRIGVYYRPKFYDPAPTSFSSQEDQIERLSYGLTTTLTAKLLSGQQDLLDLERELWRRRYLGRMAEAGWDWGDDKYAGYTDEEVKEEFERRLRLSKLRTANQYRYREFVRLEVSGTYDLRELSKPKAEGEPRRPFSDVRLQWWVKPSPYFYHRATMTINPYAGQLPHLYLYGRIRDRRGDSLAVSYRTRYDVDSNSETLRQIIGSAGLKLFGPFSMSGSIIYDLQAKKYISQSIGFNITRQCWGIGIRYHKTDDDERFAIWFTLFGLGEIYRYESTREFTGD